MAKKIRRPEFRSVEAKVRKAAVEEAAKVAEDYYSEPRLGIRYYRGAGGGIATEIRKLRDAEKG